MDKKFQVSLFFVSLLLGGMLTVQFSTVHSRTVVENTSGDYLQLSSELTSERDRQRNLYDEIFKLEGQIKSYQAKQGNQRELAAAMAEELENVKRKAGVLPVKGNGIIITIEDSFEAAEKGVVYEPAHLGSILHGIVNYLNGNEALAVAVEGHRITSLSTLRSISDYNLQVNAVMIRTDKVTIKAVGNIEQMKVGVNTFADYVGLMGKAMRIEEVKDDSLIIPAYEEPVEFKYAQPEGDNKL